MLKAALIGFGGIAQAHKNGYIQLEKEGKALQKMPSMSALTLVIVK